MPADRPRAEAPTVVSSLVGIIVAVVSGVFGISAHGLAAGTGAALPGSGQVLLVLAASAGIGAATASLARRRSPVVLTAAGLLAGQGVVHLILASGHSHGSAAHTHLAGHSVDAAAVRRAMDGANVGGTAASGHVDSLLTPGMLGAHLAAIAITLTVVAILTGTLAWVAARVQPLMATAHLVVVDLVVSRGRIAAPDARYLLSGGETRAPPVAV